MNAAEKYDRIERYLDGTLDGEALLDFEKKLNTDSALKQELELHRQIAETLKGEKVHELRGVLKNVDQQWKIQIQTQTQTKTQTKTQTQTKTAKIFNIRRVMMVAASILLIVFMAQYWFSNNSMTNQQLFANHFEPYQMILNQRTQAPADPAVGENINEAVTAYLNKDYEAASTAFQQLENNSPDAIAFRFYSAISELALGHSNKTITELEEILKDAPPILIEQCNWYLALAYLQEGNRGKAKSILEGIKSGGYQYEEAREILGWLD